MKKHRLSGLDKYVIFSLSVVLIYTIAEFITSTITQVEKSTLTMAVYGFWAGEVISCALIRIYKLKEGEENENRLDEEVDESEILACNHRLCECDPDSIQCGGK